MFTQLKSDLAQEIKSHLQLDTEAIVSLLEVPKNEAHGHLALPLFTFAKSRNINPLQFCVDLAVLLRSHKSDLYEDVQPVGGFLNFRLKSNKIFDLLFATISQSTSSVGLSRRKKGQKIIIDFSSPNIAKPMHIGHFRATIVGEAMRRLALKQGAEVISVNHIGDWGTQFGKLAWAYQNWGKEYDFTQNPIQSLVQLYVRFHDEAEKNPKLNDFGAEAFLKLEKGDPEIREIWKFIVDCSFIEYNRIYDLLNVKHDLVLGESFYNDKMDEVIRRLEEKKILKESEGARVVFFDEKDNMPPCLIKKSDGASIYATRDLAAAIYRKEHQKADEILYVVGVDQSLHFKQVFKVLELMGYDWAKSCVHISFGQYRFKEGKMSSRKGKVILAEDVLHEAIERSVQIINEKHPDLNHKNEIAQKIAIGAVIFGDLLTDRAKNVEFDLEKLLSTEGDSGPYVQYTNVRCLSLLRKFDQQLDFEQPYSLGKAEEISLAYALIQFDHVLEQAYQHFKPSLVAQYLLEVCKRFSTFYHAHRILDSEIEVRTSRMKLVKASSVVLSEGLKVLNIPVPEEM